MDKIFTKNIINTGFKYLLWIVVIAFLCFSLGMFFYVFVRGWPMLLKIFGTIWLPSETGIGGQYGALAFMIATITVTILSLIFSIPIGLFTVLFVNYFLPKKIKIICLSLIEILAGIPSILFGLFGLVVFGGWIGLNLINASLILTFMILPIFIAFVNISIQAIPKEEYYGSIALGVSKIETIFKLIIKVSKGGILAGILAGMSRAIGEAMAVMFIIGGSTAFPDLHHFWSQFLTKSGATMTSILAIEFLEAIGDHLQALFAIGILLFIVVTIINVFALVYRKRAIEKWKN